MSRAVEQPHNGTTISKIVDNIQTAVILLNGKSLRQRGANGIEQDDPVYAPMGDQNHFTAVVVNENFPDSRSDAISSIL